MGNETDYCTGNPVTPCKAIHFDSEKCNGCNICLEVCRSDVMQPNPEKGEPPIVVYPDECWFCGCCVEHCLREAIRMVPPMTLLIGWKRKTTGDYYRVGMENPPTPNLKPPVESWRKT